MDDAWLADPSVRRVAVMRLRVGLGDLLCTVPALRALRAARPDLEVSLVTWAETAPVVERMRAYVDRLVPFPGFPGIPERPPEPEGWAAFRRELGPVDVALQAYGDSAPAHRATSLVGARHVGGFWPSAAGGPPPPGHLTYPRDRHEIRRHLDLVERLGVCVPSGPQAERLEWSPTDDDRDAYDRLRQHHGLVPGGYAVVVPGATSPSRRWPAPRFGEVANRLAAQGLRPVLTGTAAEQAVTTEVARHATAEVLDLTGRTSLGSLALLLRDAEVVVGNDTGTAHLGAAVGARTVTVFLSGDPVRWSYAEPRNGIARVDVGCNPCPHLACPIDFRCARRLTVDEVMRQVDLVRRAAAPSWSP